MVPPLKWVFLGAAAGRSVWGHRPGAPGSPGSASPSRLAPIHPTTARPHTPRCPQSSHRPSRACRHCCAPADKHGRGCLPGRSCRTGRKSGSRATPSLSHEVPAEVSAVLSELVGSCQSPLPHLFRHCPRTEAPSLHRHYPASTVLRTSRHPNRPGLALVGCRLARTSRLRLGLPVLRRSPMCMHAVAITPAQPLVARIARFPSGGLPRISGGSASALPFSRPA